MTGMIVVFVCVAVAAVLVLMPAVEKKSHTSGLKES